MLSGLSVCWCPAYLQAHVTVGYHFCRKLASMLSGANKSMPTWIWPSTRSRVMSQRRTLLFICSVPYISLLFSLLVLLLRAKLYV